MTVPNRPQTRMNAHALAEWVGFELATACFPFAARQRPGFQAADSAPAQLLRGVPAGAGRRESRRAMARNKRAPNGHQDAIRVPERRKG
jgi:hypothetical protein